jgi:hypothetical protein
MFQYRRRKSRPHTPRTVRSTSARIVFSSSEFPCACMPDYTPFSSQSCVKTHPIFCINPKSWRESPLKTKTPRSSFKPESEAGLAKRLAFSSFFHSLNEELDE